MRLCKTASGMCSASRPPHALSRPSWATGSVVTWGSPGFGGDSSGVQDQLRDVRHIQATSAAFAAILGTGAIVTWGNPGSGGDSRGIQDQLRDPAAEAKLSNLPVY